MDNIEIVPIAEEHIEGFHAAVDIVAKEKKYLPVFEAPPIESTVEFVKNNIKKGYSQFVALSEGKVVGWCDIFPKSQRLMVCHVGSVGMGILPEWRGKGIGKELIKAVLESAKEKKLVRIELTVRENNVSAVSLYKKVGFEVEGVNRKARKIDDLYENVYMMALLFEE